MVAGAAAGVAADVQGAADRRGLRARGPVPGRSGPPGAACRASSAAGSAYVTYVAIVGTTPLFATGGAAPFDLKDLGGGLVARPRLRRAGPGRRVGDRARQAPHAAAGGRGSRSPRPRSSSLAPARELVVRRSACSSARATQAIDWALTPDRSVALLVAPVRGARRWPRGSASAAAASAGCSSPSSPRAPSSGRSSSTSSRRRTRAVPDRRHRRLPRRRLPDAARRRRLRRRGDRPTGLPGPGAARRRRRPTRHGPMVVQPLPAGRASPRRRAAHPPAGVRHHVGRTPTPSTPPSTLDRRRARRCSARTADGLPSSTDATTSGLVAVTDIAAVARTRWPDVTARDDRPHRRARRRRPTTPCPRVAAAAAHFGTAAPSRSTDEGRVVGVVTLRDLTNVEVLLDRLADEPAAP